MNRLKNIDFIKFLLILCIVFYHIRSIHTFYSITPICNTPFAHKISMNSQDAYLACDMFFIISGFFLFLTSSLKNNVTDLLKKNFIRFYPMLVFNAVLTIISFVFIIKIPNYLPYHQIYKLLFLDGTGIQFGPADVTWFISVLFWITLFYKYLYKIFDMEKLDLIVFVIILFCYTLIIQTFNGNISANSNYIIHNIFNVGMLRGFAGIGVGYFIYRFYNSVKNKNTENFAIRFLYTGFEISLIFFVFYHLLFHKINYSSNFLIILGFIGLFILFLIKKGYVSTFCDNKIFSILGRYVYSIYLSHLFVLYILKKYLWSNYVIFIQNHYIFSIAISLFIVIIFGIIVYYLIEKPLMKYLKSKYL